MTVISGSDGSRVIASAQWSTDAGGGGGAESGNGGSGGSSNGGSSSGGGGNPGLYLKEFVHKFKMPRLVRIVKGHYLHLGGSSALSGGGGNGQMLLLVNLGKRRRLLAQCVKFKEGSRKVASVGQKISIPADYDGYFEILSEDGRSVRCIESVAELCKRFPDSVLVRESVRAFVSRSDDVDALTEGSEAKSTRTIAEGETLILVGEAVGGGGRNRYLRCFAENGENVFLPHDLRGKFSAVAKEDNISGVHTAANLLNKRLPVMARLVPSVANTSSSSTQNQIPVTSNNGGTLKTTSTFANEMRMLAALDEDFVVGLVLSQGNKESSQVVPIPVPALIKVHSPSNHGDVCQMPEFERLVERCRELSQDITDKMTVHDIGYARDLRLSSDKGGLVHNLMNGGNASGGTGTNPRKKSRSKAFFLPSSNGSHSGSGRSNSPKDDWDEIEQIYDYVRGFAPLPRSAKGWRWENSAAAAAAHAASAAAATADPNRSSKEETDTLNGSGGSYKSRQQMQQSPVPPVPPPIETIPSLQHHLAQPMEYSSAATTPPRTPSWDPNADTYGMSMFYKDSKKRHRSRPNAAPADENLYPTVTNRFIKSATAPHRMMNGSSTVQKHKMFFGRQRSVPKDAPHPNNGGVTLHPMMSMTLSRSNLYNPSYGGNGNGGGGKHSSHHHHNHHPASFFHMRYKSLTNLHNAHLNPNGGEYDTLESSNSGGKTSGGADSGGSRTLPEKRRRGGGTMSRPKSLTNLVWGNTAERGGGSGRHSVLMAGNKEAVVTTVPAPQPPPPPTPQPRVTSSGFFHGLGRQTPTVVKSHLQMHHSSKLGSRASKKVGTLYL